MTSLASYIALRDDATEVTQSIRDRLTVIETSLRERREYQDQQTRQIVERVERLERREQR